MELLVKLPQNTFYVDDKPVEYAVDKTVKTVFSKY